jgi:hypothetical protein
LFPLLRERSGLKSFHQGIFYALEAATCHALLNEGFEPWLMDFDANGRVLPNPSMGIWLSSVNEMKISHKNRSLPAPDASLTGSTCH